MAHELDMSNNRANMAFVGETPWHGLGQELTPDSPIEVWCEQAGLNWQAVEHPLFLATTGNDQMERLAGYKALKRSDTGMTLAVLKDGYKVVQPLEVLEFHRSLVDQMGYKLETAGVLFGGKRVWALARTGEEMTIMGQDRVNGYVLVATSFDGSMATIVTRTSVRVVCYNTMTFAVGENGTRADVRISHIAKFKPDIIKGQLGLETNAAWEAYEAAANELARRRVSRDEAVRFMLDTFYPKSARIESVDELLVNEAIKRQIGNLLSVYEHGIGQQTRSANGTAWGLVNAITRWSDHERGTRTQDARLNRAWFGDSETIKRRAFDNALSLVA